MFISVRHAAAHMVCVINIFEFCATVQCSQIATLCSVGGLKEGLVVELSNGSNAMVLEVTGQQSLLLSLSALLQPILC